MYQFKTNSDTPFQVDRNGIVKVIGKRDFVTHYFEIKLSDYVVNSLIQDGFTFSWIGDFIEKMGEYLPSNTLEFEKLIKQNWKWWLTQGWVIENDFPRYRFDEKIAAYDMREYYGNKSKRSGIFRKRWDIPMPKVEVLIKDENFKHLYEKETRHYATETV